MSQTPTPETPSRAMVREVAGHPLQRRAIKAALATAAVAFPTWLAQVQAIPGVHLPLVLTGTILGAAAFVTVVVVPILNSLDAADQAARAAVRGPQDVLGVPDDGEQDLFPPGTVPPGGRLS